MKLVDEDPELTLVPLGQRLPLGRCNDSRRVSSTYSQTCTRTCSHTRAHHTGREPERVQLRGTQAEPLQVDRKATSAASASELVGEQECQSVRVAIGNAGTRARGQAVLVTPVGHTSSVSSSAGDVRVRYHSPDDWKLEADCHLVHHCAGRHVRKALSSDHHAGHTVVEPVFYEVAKDSCGAPFRENSSRRVPGARARGSFLFDACVAEFISEPQLSSSPPPLQINNSPTCPTTHLLSLSRECRGHAGGLHNPLGRL